MNQNVASIVADVELIVGMFPSIVAAVSSVEQTLPIPQSGAQKLDLVKEILNAAYNLSHANAAAMSFETLWPEIMTIVNKVVALFNLVGIFKNGAPGVAPDKASMPASAVANPAAADATQALSEAAAAHNSEKGNPGAPVVEIAPTA